MSTHKQCLKCRHLLQFEAVDGIRYVCILKGKRIITEPENCDGFNEVLTTKK